MDEFSSLRDMLLMSHLQDKVVRMNLPILQWHNGGCARLGLVISKLLTVSYKSCMLVDGLRSCLVSWWHFQDNIRMDQQKLERRLQMPIHLHINLGLLEAVYLISTMHLEVSNRAENPPDTQGKVSGNAFSKLLETSQRNSSTKPPNNVRYHIISAATALSKGNFQKSFNIIKSLSFWRLLENQHNALEMVKTKMEEEALKTYMFTHSVSQDSLSLDQITTMFELSRPHLHRIVKKVL